MEILLAHWKWFVGIASGIFGFGVTYSRLVKKNEIYNKDGSQIYTPRDEFKETIKEIAQINKDQTDTMTNVNFQLGKIDQFMKDHIK